MVAREAVCNSKQTHFWPISQTPQEWNSFFTFISVTSLFLLLPPAVLEVISDVGAFLVVVLDFVLVLSFSFFPASLVPSVPSGLILSTFCLFDSRLYDKLTGSIVFADENMLGVILESEM